MKAARPGHWRTHAGATRLESDEGDDTVNVRAIAGDTTIDAGADDDTINVGNLAPDMDMKALIKKVNREDLWRGAAKSLGVPAAEIPASTSRGKETFFDGKVFDPENPSAYLKSLSIKRADV